VNRLISYLIRDGNLTGVGVTLALLVGLLTMIGSLYFFNDQSLRILGASLGLMLVSFGGYSARAKTLGLRPFDNTYKKVRGSCNKGKDESSGS